jgi:hypothetical protein
MLRHPIVKSMKSKLGAKLTMTLLSENFIFSL